MRSGGGFWLASEGNPERKEGVLPDRLLAVSATGVIEAEYLLPEDIAKHAVRFGFEGVTATARAQTKWSGSPFSANGKMIRRG